MEPKTEQKISPPEHSADVVLRYFEALVESSDDAIISKDLNGIIQTWNGAAGRIFGYTAGEIVGKSVTTLIPTDHANEEPEILSRLRRGEKIDHYETIRQRKDGSLVNISLTVSPIKDGKGTVIGASKIARDITDQKRMAEILEATVAARTLQLRETIAELEAFSYSISHDMRSPLRAMQGYAKVLLTELSGQLPPEAVQSLSRIDRAAGRLDLLIRDILAYGKIAKGQIELKPLALGPLLEDIIQQHPELQECRDHIFTDQLLHSVMGHEAYLTQCLTNLIENGLKFIEPGAEPQVRVQSEVAGEKVRVWVMDNGIGIAPEHYDRIFQIFGRVHPEKAYPGTGIGLAIVKKAVARMGGEAGFESTPGAGSKFWFTLPKASHGH
jgi:PAS domain S-box-containing protein